MGFVRKSLWLATNFASDLIKNSGKGRNNAIEISSNHYDVPLKEIDEQLRFRQSKGQKGKKRGVFKYYVFNGIYMTCVAENCSTNRLIKIFKATSSENARKQYSSERCLGGYANHYATTYITNQDWEDGTKEFSNKKDAEIYYKNILNEQEKKDIESIDEPNLKVRGLIDYTERLREITGNRIKKAEE